MNNSVVLTFGTFDLLHMDHLSFLRRCADLGNVWVGLGTDEYQAVYKREPAQSWSQRADTLYELPWIAGVLEREQVDTRPLMERLMPDFLVAGTEWAELPYLEMSGLSIEYLNSMGTALVFLPSVHRVHTTDTIADIVRKHTPPLQ